MANTPACKLNTKMVNGQAQGTNTAAAVAAPVNTVKQMLGIFGKPAPAQQPAPQTAPQ